MIFPSNQLPLVFEMTGHNGPYQEMMRLRIVEDEGRGFIAQIGVEGPTSAAVFVVPISFSELTPGANVLDTLQVALNKLTPHQKEYGYAWDRIADMARGFNRTVPEIQAGTSELRNN